MLSLADQQQFAALDEVVRDVRVAMLITTAEDGSLHARPMLTASRRFGRELYFITRVDDTKPAETREDKHVSVAYACSERDKYAAISGMAVEVVDRTTLESLWAPEFEDWFPAGLDDPSLRLLLVQVTRAEYWDAESTLIGRVVERLKSVIPGSSARV